MDSSSELSDSDPQDPELCEENSEDDQGEENDHTVKRRVSIIPPRYWNTVGKTERERNGSLCPLCHEPWTSGGDHHLCCLPCGDIFGLSCIKKWFADSQGLNECPKCIKRCALGDIRLLYAPQSSAAVGRELQKKVKSLEAECVSLQIENDEWSKKEGEWKEKEADLCKKVRFLDQKNNDPKSEEDDHTVNRHRSIMPPGYWDTVAKTKDERMELEGNTEVDDGSLCPICHQSWSSGGDHQVCCLPCGHIYGFSCIKEWLRKWSSKCPNCYNECAVKDIRRLWANQIFAVDGELQKKVQSLEAECDYLQIENDDWSKMEVQWKKKEADLCRKVRYLEERTHNSEDLLEDSESRASGSYGQKKEGP